MCRGVRCGAVRPAQLRLHNANGNQTARQPALRGRAGQGYLDVTSVNRGVACQDTATGSGYLLYSAASVYTRLAAHPPFGANADHFICVRYNGGWQYDTHTAYYSFTPRVH